MKVTAAISFNSGEQDPKIQIWRENKTHPGLFYKIISDISLDWATPPCYRSRYNQTNGTIQCILTEETSVSVQPGDFLGLEIPPQTTITLKYTSKVEDQLTMCFYNVIG